MYLLTLKLNFLINLIFSKTNFIWNEDRVKVYINDPGHMAKVVAMPIYGKNLCRC